MRSVPATRKKRRLYAVIAGMACLSVAAALVGFAFKNDIRFFMSPSDLRTTDVRPDQTIRLGGIVADGSEKTLADGVTLEFVVTDGANTVKVHYKGLKPDLFREGQGVVTIGKMGQNGIFVASEVLAKHDETYMPKEVADALKKTGHWKEGERK